MPDPNKPQRRLGYWEIIEPVHREVVSVNNWEGEDCAPELERALIWAIGPAGGRRAPISVSYIPLC